ncbi:MAG: endonuclease MutS2 [candidate division Zixibacteria bacterium]|jgi:DNA mismatch repair protein MutS2|nr:endonuclease MutS2 [candidate division Zixibacteria bacterium]
MIDPHTLETLEFDKVLSRIAGQCITPYGHGEVAKFLPTTDRDAIELRHREIGEMLDIVTVGAAFPLARMEDAREVLAKTAVEGIFLDPDEIRTVLELIEVSADIFDYDRDGRDSFPLIAEYISRMRAFPELRKDINRTIDERGEIKDSASPQLRRIRIEMGDSKRRLLARLESILAGQQKQSGWQTDVITQRNGRYVIPILAGQYKADSGILHDRSQSGATFYIEPNETVEMNNRLNMLMQEERLEIDRILRALTAEIASHRPALEENIRVIGRLDSYHAAARFGRAVGAARPRIDSEAGFSLVNARHPLLVAQSGIRENVIPLTLDLGETRQAVLVTGPNTGGKTIALKTIGLLVLMSQSGLPISADPTSRMGIFEQIYADIGDEQSIELSLSTFSSHIRNIISAVKGLSDRTLVLFDEIGAGTDPKEGAALAEAIILHVISHGARLVATTHYSQLKTLPLQHPEIENASLEFNRETLAPTFRLQVGIPGSSYAVEIASRLGMPESVCAHAAKLIGSGERSLGELIASLEAELKKVKEDQSELSERLAKAKELESYFRAQSERLTRDVDDEKRKALAEVDRLLEQSRRDTEQLVADIRKSQADKETVKQAHRRLRDLKQEAARQTDNLRADKTAPTEPATFAEGDLVRIMSLGQTGEIEQVQGDRARVRLGQFTTTVELRSLERLAPSGSASTRKHAAAASAFQVNESVSPEIHLRGMTVEEATDALEKYLDRARLAGLGQVYVVHGKGSGALRRSLTAFLKGHADVESLRLGNWNEGGAGVTIVKLRQ